jgi:hypothetical protein
VWLWSYQLMTEPRRRQVDAFVARQAKVDQTERQRMLGRKKA